MVIRDHKKPFKTFKFRKSSTYCGLSVIETCIFCIGNRQKCIQFAKTLMIEKHFVFVSVHVIVIGGEEERGLLIAMTMIMII